MPEHEVRVVFQPHGREGAVLAGSSLLEAAARVDLTIDTPCGGAGRCGKCRVQVMRGAAPPHDVESDVFGAAELAEGWRLACQTHLITDTSVYVPDGSLFGGQHQILTAADTESVDELCPAVRKVYVELPEPTLESGAPDLMRIEQHTGALRADLSLVRELPSKLRAARFHGTAVLTDHHLIDFEPGDTTGQRYGMAFDVGTTTLVGSLVDLNTGEERSVVSRMNPQVRYGDDVLSRIRHAIEKAEGLEELRRAVTAEFADMAAELCTDAGIHPEHVYEASFSGNTTMQHLLCGVDPSPLGRLPFVPAHGRGLLVPAAELDLPIHPRGFAYVFPVIGGFVGGDTVAGMLATRIDGQDGPTLMVDIGTNGEIVLSHDGQIWAASTAAGPAFEGARISCGMRAARGAIEKVVFEDDVHCSAIGDAPPVGLCGSGLIDAVAELLRCGVVSTRGRLLEGDALPARLPERLRRRVQRLGDEAEFVLVDSVTPVTLKQRDIRELQLASGAIRAGISILLKQAGVGLDAVEHIRIAGGFGSFIRRRNAQRIGLLPPEVDRSRINHVGNASLSGARWALLSTKARAHAEDIARRTQHVELSRDDDFDMEFAMAMLFPEA